MGFKFFSWLIRRKELLKVYTANDKHCLLLPAKHYVNLFSTFLPQYNTCSLIHDNLLLQRNKTTMER